MKLSQMDRLYNQLNKKVPFTAGKLAANARMSRDSVYKRIYDLKNEGFKVVIEPKTVKGKTVNTYRFG